MLEVSVWVGEVIYFECSMLLLVCESSYIMETKTCHNQICITPVSPQRWDSSMLRCGWRPEWPAMAGCLFNIEFNLCFFLYLFLTRSYSSPLPFKQYLPFKVQIDEVNIIHETFILLVTTKFLLLRWWVMHVFLRFENSHWIKVRW